MMAHCRHFLFLQHREEGDNIVAIAFLLFKYKEEGDGIVVVTFFTTKQH